MQAPNNYQAEQLKQFWQGQLVEVSEVPADPVVFKNHQLPLARIKKIMKSDEDVRMISAEAPVLFAKACEMFILELTLRSWMHAEENKRRTLQRNDVAAAITKTDIFDFLLDIVPREDLKPEDGVQAGGAGSSAPAAAPAAPMASAGASSTVPAGVRPPVPAPLPGLAPGSLFFPYQMPPGMATDPTQAAAAAAAAAMMRPPLPLPAMDPALMSLYQQQFLSGQGWPPMPGLPPPPNSAAAAVVQQQAAVAAAAAAAAAGAAQAQAHAQAQAQAQASQAAGQQAAPAASGQTASGQASEN